MEITERQWRNLNDKLNDIMSEIKYVEDKVRVLEKRTKKRGLTFEAALPPKAICVDVVNSVGTRYLDNPMQILSDYYSIERMKTLVDCNKVPKTAIACYHPSEKTAYYPDNSAGMDVTLHEFFHHLVAEGVVYLKAGQKEEHWANKFAEIVMLRGASK